MNNHDATQPLVDLLLATVNPKYEAAFKTDRTYFGIGLMEILNETQGGYLETGIPRVKKLLNKYKRGDRAALKMALGILTYYYVEDNE